MTAMYAITSSSYRAIASSADVLPGETAVDAIPASLTAALLVAEVRQRRDALLAACDWTQAPTRRSMLGQKSHGQPTARRYATCHNRQAFQIPSFGP